MKFFSKCKIQTLARVIPKARNISVSPRPGGRLGVSTDRNQQRWIFLNYPRKYFSTHKKAPKKYFLNAKPYKIPSKYTADLADSKHDKNSGKLCCLIV